jgi:hypothetical protein
VSPLAALYALGLDLGDLAIMRRDLLEAIDRANHDLLFDFGARP